MRYGKKEERREGFVSIALAQHNATIPTIQYSNPRVTKPLFYMGCVLPDFKISWVVLGCYLMFKYPLSLKTLICNYVRETKTSLYLLAIRRYKK